MKEDSIKKTLPRLTQRLVFLFLILILPVNIGLQMYLQHKNHKESTDELFRQLEQVIQTNERDLEQEKQVFSEKCIQSAEMAAYFVEHFPKVVSNLENTRELAQKLDVDELHFFTSDGTIYAGSHPEYYGFSFYSGEQMSFFLPMLEDPTLELCQEIMPNTAEGKEMQYAAVWMEDGSGIVQIGMEPERLLQQMEEKSLKKVVQNFLSDMSSYLHVVDRDTNQIIASTAENLLGYDLNTGKMEDWEETKIVETHRCFRGKSYCVYIKPYQNYLLVRTYLSMKILKGIVMSTILSLLYILLVGMVIVRTIIWYINKKLSNNLILIVDDLKKIENGNLENITITTGIKEFDELILYINQLLKSIRLNWNKLTSVIDKSQIPIGVFEYNLFYKKLYMNERLLEILGIENDKKSSMETMAHRVESKLDRIRERMINGGEHVYKYNRNGEELYLRIEKLTDEQSVTYYVTDVSQMWKEIHLLRVQSSRDSLTELYNRRGFHERLEILFSAPKKIGNAVLIMLDADGLKEINDIYGHLSGDEYLKQISRIINSAASKNVIAARLGGDEFAVFLYGYDSKEEIERKMRELQERRGEYVLIQGRKTAVEFSMGWAFYPEDSEDYHEMMHKADEEMYEDKRRRKGRQ